MEFPGSGRQKAKEGRTPRLPCPDHAKGAVARHGKDAQWSREIQTFGESPGAPHSSQPRRDRAIGRGSGGVGGRRAETMEPRNS